MRRRNKKQEKKQKDPFSAATKVLTRQREIFSLRNESITVHFSRRLCAGIFAELISAQLLDVELHQHTYGTQISLLIHFCANKLLRPSCELHFFHFGLAI